MKRLIENTKYTDKRVMPSNSWQNFTSVIKSAFGELNGEEALERLYVDNRLINNDEFYLLSHFLGLSISEVENIYKNSKSKNLSVVLHHNPLVIKGREGTGKSTYLKYHLKYKAVKKFGLPILPIFIDYKVGPPSIDLIKKFSVQETSKQLTAFISEHLKVTNIFTSIELRESLCKEQFGIYKNLFEKLKEKPIEIEKLKTQIYENIYKDTESLNRALSTYIQEELNYNIILISDNLDHHLDENYIATVFTVSMNEKAAYNSNLIICIRDYSYGIAVKARLRAYDYHVFNLTPPDLVKLMSVRVNYVTLQCDETPNFDAAEKSETKQKISILLEESQNKILRDFAGDNIRLLLASAKRILSSGHFKFYNNSEGELKLEFYDYLKALMLGSRVNYMPPEFDNECEVINLFENGNPLSYGNNLVRLRLLQIMRNEGQYIQKEPVIEKMVALGYDKSEVNLAIHVLTAHQLIESSETGSGNKNTLFLIFTDKGKYHLDKIIYELTYIEEIRVATYLPDNIFEQILRSRLDDRKDGVRQRLAEIEQFIDYIKDKEETEKKIVSQNIESLKIYNNINLFRNIANTYKTHIESIRKSLP